MIKRDADLTNTPGIVPDDPQSTHPWITLATCFLVVAITHGTGFSFGVFLNPLRQGFGMSVAAVSGAYSVALWAFAFSGIVGGWAVDRYGPRITIMLGAFVLGSGLFLTSFTHSLWQLYMTFGLIGVGLCTGYVPTMTTISRSFTTRRGLALGILGAGIGFGPLMMAPLATHLISTGGWRFAYRLVASIALINIPVALLLKGSRVDQHHQNRNSANTQRGAGREEGPKGTHPLSGLSGVTWAFKRSVFWLFCLLFFSIGVSVQTVMAHIVAYSQSEGASPMTAAAVLSTVTGASMAGRLAMGIASDSIGRRRALVLCTFSEGIMILCLVAASAPSSFFLFGFLFGFFYGGHAPQLPALIGETLGFESMGAILGVVNLFWGIGSTIGPFVTGYLFDMTGSYSIGFTVAAAAIFSASALGFILRTPERKSID